MQVVPLGGRQAQAVHEGVDGLPAQANGRAAHGRVHPLAAHAAEQAEGLRVVGPQDDGFGVVVVKLEAFSSGFGLGVWRDVEGMGNRRQFPRRPWWMAMS